jgi:hypothetical protein
VLLPDIKGRRRKRNFKRFASFFGITTVLFFFRNNNSTSSAPLAPFGGAPTDCRKEILQFHTLSGGRDPWLEPGLMIADEFALTVKIFMFAEK